MIQCLLSDAPRYIALNRLFAPLFDFVRTHDLLQMPLGRIELDGNNLFINNVEPTLLLPEDQKLEIHRNYIDVHIPLNGQEIIGWSPLSKLANPVKSYDEASDCALYSDKASTYFTLHPGECFICFPEDAHAPVIGEGKLRKAIAKVALGDNGDISD